MCPYWFNMCPCKKSLKVQEKSFQAFVCVYLNAIELKKERSFANLSHQTLIWPQCLSPMVWTICPEVEKNQLLSFARRTILLQILWSKCYIVQEIVLFINERQLCLANQSNFHASMKFIQI